MSKFRCGCKATGRGTYGESLKCDLVTVVNTGLEYKKYTVITNMGKFLVNGSSSDEVLTLKPGDKFYFQYVEINNVKILVDLVKF